MSLWDLVKKHSRKLENKSTRVPFSFEIHADEYSLSVKSVLDKSAVFELFFKGVKRLRQKSEVNSIDFLPDVFKANKQQLKALESVVINADFLAKVSKQVIIDVPTFKILNSRLDSLTWEAIGKDKYLQSITIKGTCYYEESK